jgi:nucleotide-binding universal stress UspA family protein
MKTTPTQTRIQLKNILYCTDLSEAASSALPYAVGLARHFGSTVHALHVRHIVQPAVAPPFGEPMEPIVLGPKIMEIREEIQDKFNAFSNVQNEIMIADGEILLSVLNAIEEKQIDLIVLGTHGRTGPSKLVLGSIAEEIFRNAPCAVLTVGPHAPAAPARDGEFTEILYATDFSAEALTAAPYALSLAQEFQANLTLLHVIEGLKVSDLATRAEVESAFKDRLRQIMPPGSELWCEPHFMVLQGNAPEDILSVAKNRNTDLIILGVRRPGGFVTHLPIATAHKVVSNANCPVLTVRG